MSTIAHSGASHHQGWFARTEAWLDDKGKPAWIAAMVLGFIAFWPVGLALLFYMIWSKNMFCSTARTKTHNRSCGWSGRSDITRRSTGNAAFDAYRGETLRRLEEEQHNFEAFLQRLRDARDKAEFDQFMDERTTAAAAPHADDEPERGTA
ncbi:MAG: DUF2852 domain-containing protein [Roseovarius sp.]